jgi:hypothetical protein
MENKLGGFFGFLILGLYALTVLNYLLKWINKRYGVTLKTHEKGYGIFKKAMRTIIKNHKLFGLLTVLFLVTHFFIQFNQYGFNITGTVAAGVMIFQVLLGIYGSLSKKKGKTWLYFHRSIALLLFLAIVLHLILAI